MAESSDSTFYVSNRYIRIIIPINIYMLIDIYAYSVYIFRNRTKYELILSIYFVYFKRTYILFYRQFKVLITVFPVYNTSVPKL